MPADWLEAPTTLIRPVQTGYRRAAEASESESVILAVKVIIGVTAEDGVVVNCRLRKNANPVERLTVAVYGDRNGTLQSAVISMLGKLRSEELA